MPRLQRRSFGAPDEVCRFHNGHIDYTISGKLAVRMDGGTELGLGIRLGIHTGEVLVSGTTHDLREGAGLSFEDRGVHELEGLSGARPIFALRKSPPSDT